MATEDQLGRAKEFVEQHRREGWPDAKIWRRLAASGWSDSAIQKLWTFLEDGGLDVEKDGAVMARKIDPSKLRQIREEDARARQQEQTPSKAEQVADDGLQGGSADVPAPQEQSTPDQRQEQYHPPQGQQQGPQTEYVPVPVPQQGSGLLQGIATGIGVPIGCLIGCIALPVGLFVVGAFLAALSTLPPSSTDMPAQTSQPTRSGAAPTHRPATPPAQPAQSQPTSSSAAPTHRPATPPAQPAQSQPTSSSAATTRWVKVKEWQGSGMKNTETFTVGGEWALEWYTEPDQFDGNFIVDIKRPGAQFGTLAANVIGSNHDNSRQYGGGTFYLEILSTQRWHVVVWDK